MITICQQLEMAVQQEVLRLRLQWFLHLMPSYFSLLDLNLKSQMRYMTKFRLDS